jgi:hypothetical protein
VSDRSYVAPVSFGLGDLVVSLPAVQALIEHGEETWLVARSDAQARLAGRIGGLAGTVDEQAFDRDGHGGSFIDLRDHPLQRDWWWGSDAFAEAFPSLSINDILSRICADFDIPADFTRPIPLTAALRPEYATSVLLVCEGEGASKHWSTERWSSLADALRAQGLDPRVVTRDIAPTLGDAVDILSSGRAVIGVDTGLTHLAVQQGTPTVTICRPPPVYFRGWSHTRVVVGDRCDDACVAAENEYAYNETVDMRGFAWQPRTCPVMGRCLDAVRPTDILDELNELL